MGIQNITDLKELKAMAYDQIANKEQAERNLTNINERIGQILAMPTADPEPTKSESVDSETTE